MSKQLTSEDIRNAKGAYLYDEDTYVLYSSSSRRLEISIFRKENVLTLSGYDYGSECSNINGKDEYEFHYSLSGENTQKFFERLKDKYENFDELESALKEEFGTEDGSVRFREFCDRNGVKHQFISF